MVRAWGRHCWLKAHTCDLDMRKQRSSRSIASKSCAACPVRAVRAMSAARSSETPLLWVKIAGSLMASQLYFSMNSLVT